MNAALWENSFLNWFSGLDIPMTESILKLGGLEFYTFSAFKNNYLSNIDISGFGSDPSRKIAAVKCAAETIERITMFDYFSEVSSLPLGLQTSNGWAVHQTKAIAKQNALNEAIERHLLLKSYLLHGWDGFRLHSQIKTDELTIYLNLSKFTYQNKAAILIATQSKKYNGVSFGYGLANLTDIDKSDFWLSAIFESINRVLIHTSENVDLEKNNKSWIRTEIDFYLNTVFDFSIFNKKYENLNFHEADSTSANIDYVTLDLKEKYKCDFSLFAVYARSNELIPLFSKSVLDAQGLIYLESNLAKHGIKDIPERTPIL